MASCCSLVSDDGVLERVTGAVNLVAVLEPALPHITADQGIRNIVTELVTGRILQFLPVEKSDTVVLIYINCWLISEILRAYNSLAVLVEPCPQFLIGRT